jgi:hypothetical protein
MIWHPETACNESALAVAEVVDLLRADIDKSGSVAVWARENRISVPYVHDVVRGNRQPGAKILAAMGLEKIVSYSKETH